MMEIRIIDGKMFIASRTGKRELVQPPAEATADARARIAQAEGCIASLRQSEATAQAWLESVVLAGTDATKSRAELGAIHEEIDGHERDASEAQAIIREVTALIDTHAAAGIREAAKRRLSDLLTPFDQALKEIHP